MRAFSLEKLYYSIVIRVFEDVCIHSMNDISIVAKTNNFCFNVKPASALFKVSLVHSNCNTVTVRLGALKASITGLIHNKLFLSPKVIAATWKRMFEINQDQEL